MLDSFKTFIWYYRKISKNTLLLDVFFLIFSGIIFLKSLNAIYLLVMYIMIYSLNKNNLIELSNSILAGTPIKIKDVVNFNSFIIWGKATIVILLGLVASLLIKNIIIQTILIAIEYIIFAYPFLNLIFTLKHFIPRPYRNLAFYSLAGLFVGAFYFSNILNFRLKFIIIMGLSVIILIVSKIFEKKLSFENILRNEEKQ